MKKMFSVILTLVLLLSCCASLAEESAQTTECPEEARFYEGIWSNVDAQLEMYWEEEGYKVLITYPRGDGLETDWEYSCLVAEDNSLVSMPFGIRKEINGDSVEIVYEDGEARFYINEENYLAWKNEKEELEIETRFVKLSPGDFDGYWVSENCVVEMYFEEEGYKILVREVEGDNVKETEYSAFYHEEDNTVVTLEGEAVFSKNEDGCMVWNGIVFERLDPPSEE